VFGLPEWASRLLTIALVAVGAVVALTVLRWMLPRLAARAGAGAEPARARQRQTAIRLLATTLRYLVVIGAAVAIAIVLAGGGGLGAISGGALLVLLVGFASQRLLIDVIAGFFILFEDQYGVGDFIRIEPTGYAGVVEEVGLRSTVLRDLNGDALYVPNGSISAVRRVPGGVRAYRLEVVTRDAAAVEAAVDAATALGGAAGAAFVLPPRVVERRPAGEGLEALVVEASVPPSLEWLVDAHLVGTLRARAGDALVGDPAVATVSPGALDAYRATILAP
jgi:hypothetical protein